MSLFDFGKEGFPPWFDEDTLIIRPEAGQELTPVEALEIAETAKTEAHCKLVYIKVCKDSSCEYPIIERHYPIERILEYTGAIDEAVRSLSALQKIFYDDPGTANLLADLCDYLQPETVEYLKNLLE